MKPFKNVFILAAFPILFLECDTRAQSEEDVLVAEEPQLCGEGYWCADFNQAQIACYEGSMKACDSIWLSGRVLMDTWLFNYGRTCGGRVSLRAIQRLSTPDGGAVTCADVFPGH